MSGGHERAKQGLSLDSCRVGADSRAVELRAGSERLGKHDTAMREALDGMRSLVHVLIGALVFGAIACGPGSGTYSTLPAGDTPTPEPAAAVPPLGDTPTPEPARLPEPVETPTTGPAPRLPAPVETPALPRAPAIPTAMATPSPAPAVVPDSPIAPAPERPLQPAPGPPQATPDPGLQLVPAPIDGLEVVMRESFPPQYSVRVKAGLPSGCARPATHQVARDGTTFYVTVLNRLPAGNPVCTAIYGMYELNVDLGSALQPGTTYRIEVNDKATSFVAQ